jgi:hypothetical protein
MNILSRDKQIEIIAALCEGVGQRAAARLADVDRKTIARLALQVGKGCAELHDRRVVGVRVARTPLDSPNMPSVNMWNRFQMPDHRHASSDDAGE